MPQPPFWREAARFLRERRADAEQAKSDASAALWLLVALALFGILAVALIAAGMAFWPPAG